MKEKNRRRMIAVISWFAACICANTAAMIECIERGEYVTMFLCLGSAFLCMGAAMLNRMMSDRDSDGRLAETEQKEI